MTSEIRLRLYEELNEFLPLNQRKHRFGYELNGIRTLGGLLANLKIPRDQVELALVNGDSVGFSHRLKADDFVSLYPVFEAFDVTSLLRARKKPLRRIQFVAGPGLLRLSRYLRMLGFDVLESGSSALEKIIPIAEGERRILLTRDSSLLESPELSHVYFIRAAKPKDQLRDVLSRLDLFDALQRAHLQPVLPQTCK
jgi:uncharacterized protein